MKIEFANAQQSQARLLLICYLPSTFVPILSGLQWLPPDEPHPLAGVGRTKSRAGCARYLGLTALAILIEWGSYQMRIKEYAKCVIG